MIWRIACFIGLHDWWTTKSLDREGRRQRVCMRDDCGAKQKYVLADLGRRKIWVNA